jgi:hypothetical protein
LTGTLDAVDRDGAGAEVEVVGVADEGVGGGVG